jgi:NADPH:quinone reductase-like Zn-dependent oxidoreductase
MKAIRLHAPGVDGLRFETIETPALRAGEVLVEVHAAAITHRGFQVAFAVGAVFAAAAAAIGGAYIRPKPMVVPDAEAVDEVAVPIH